MTGRAPCELIIAFLVLGGCAPGPFYDSTWPEPRPLGRGRVAGTSIGRTLAYFQSNATPQPPADYSSCASDSRPAPDRSPRRMRSVVLIL